MNQETALLHALWRKGLQSETPVRIPCAAKSDATRLRWALYNAVAKYRPEGSKHGQADAVLAEAIENCSLSVEGKEPGPFALVIQRKTLTNLMQTIAAVLGDAPIVDAVDAAAKESEARMMEKLQGLTTPTVDASAGAVRSTPYYTRDN